MSPQCSRYEKNCDISFKNALTSLHLVLMMRWICYGVRLVKLIELLEFQQLKLNYLFFIISISKENIRLDILPPTIIVFSFTSWSSLHDLTNITSRILQFVNYQYIIEFFYITVITLIIKQMRLN